jgi:hypothetical protein
VGNSKKRVERMNMVDALSTHVCVWNIETCPSHLEEGSEEQGT